MNYNRLVPPDNREDRNDLSAYEAEFKKTLIIAVGGLVVAAGVSLIFIFDHLITKKYMAPFFLYKTSLLFGQTEPRKLVDDPGEVTIFRTAITTARDIEAHHTHPIDQIRFIFPDDPSKVYLLGRDSSNYEEFWLEADAFNGPVDLKQFRSATLTDWLRRHAVR